MSAPSAGALRQVGTPMCWEQTAPKRKSADGICIGVRRVPGTTIGTDKGTFPAVQFYIEEPGGRKVWTNAVADDPDEEFESPDAVDVHTMFGLTYANYLVLHRTLLQSMPEDWQHRFTAMVAELETAYAHIEHPPGYTVNVRGAAGRFERDPIPHYNRGRTFVPPRIEIGAT